MHVLKLNVRAGGLELSRLGGFKHQRLRIQQREGAFTGGARLNDLILQLGQVFQRLIHEKNTADQLQKICGVGMALRAVNQIRQQERHAAGAEKFDERAGDNASARDAHVMTDIPAGDVLKLSGHDGFQVVGLDDTVAGEGFGHGLGQLGGLRLEFAAGPADFAVENGDGNNAGRQEDEGDERQLGLLPQAEMPPRRPA